MFLAFILSSVILGTAQAGDYRLYPGDVITIGVWGHEELTGREGDNSGIFIRPDGKLAFPLAGEVYASGLTVAELTGLITEKLGNYLVNPKVSINIIKYHTIRIYVLGEVNKPGLYEIDKQHNLLDAIGMACGYTKDAAKKHVFIIRKDKVQEPIKANLLQLLKRGDITQNYVLEEGDLVYLSSNGRIDFARDIMCIMSGIKW
jgi:polysaccharide export outer membrane protein